MPLVVACPPVLLPVITNLNWRWWSTIGAHNGQVVAPCGMVNVKEDARRMLSG